MDLIPYLLKISVLNKNLINTFYAIVIRNVSYDYVYAKHTCRINFALTRNVTKFEYSIIS